MPVKRFMICVFLQWSHIADYPEERRERKGDIALQIS